MSRVSRYVIGVFLPVFIGANLFFVLIIQMVDILANLTDYMGSSINLATIAYIQLLYLPKSLVTGLPVAMVFATSYSMGNLQIRNELLAFYATGFSLRQIVHTMFILAAFFGLGMFYIQEFVSIPFMQERQVLVDTALNRPPPLSNSNVQIYDKKKNLVYHAQYYNNDIQEIQNLILVKRDDSGKLSEVLRAERAIWKDGSWLLQNMGKIELVSDGSMKFNFIESYINPDLNIPPGSFSGGFKDFDALMWQDAMSYINLRRTTGLSYREEETKLLSRISFAFTPLVVMLLAISAGRKFRKHVVLLSLLVSLGLAVLFYVTQLVAGLLANLNMIPPLAGAWLSVILLLLVGFASLFNSQRV